jgi:methyl-accepting chemotaxis protein
MAFFQPATLRVKLVLLVAVLLGAMATTMLLFFPAHMSRLARSWVERRASGMALLLADALAPYLDFEDDDGARAFLARSAEANGIAYAGVRLDRDGSLYAAWKPQEVPSYRPPVRPGTHFAGGRLHVITRIVPKDKQEMAGVLLLGFPLEELQRERRESYVVVSVACAALLLLGLGYSLIVGTLLVRPIRELTRVTSNIVAEGDLTQEIRIEQRDEVGVLARSFREMVRKLRTIPATLARMVELVADVTGHVSETATVVSSGAQDVQHRVDETSAAVAAMRASVQGIAQNVTTLHQNAQSTTRSNHDLVVITAALERRVEGVAEIAGAAERAVATSTDASREIAGSLTELQSSITSISAAMTQMSTAIGQVEDHAREALRFSQAVSADAANGVGAMDQTLAGIQQIRLSSENLARVVTSLGGRIEGIERFLGVIVDLADQTNLLSLNAAIMAAQAGEHGKGFSVVADEIKELARRTSASAREIQEVVEGVQQESRAALAAIGEGSRKVDEGLRLGQEAQAALKANYESANEAAAMVQRIAESTVRQAHSAKEVTASMQKVGGSVRDISVASAGHVRTSEQIQAVIKEMRDTSTHVHQATLEQGQVSRTITHAVDNIEEMLARLEQAQSAELAAAGQALLAVQAIKEIVDAQRGSVGTLNQAVSDLRARAEGLRTAVRQFRV